MKPEKILENLKKLLIGSKKIYEEANEANLMGNDYYERNDAKIDQVDEILKFIEISERKKR